MTVQPIRSRLARVAAIAAVSLGLAAAPAAMAQSQSQFTDDQLNAFAETVVAVNPLIASWNQKIQAAESQEQAQQLAQQARGEVISEIEKGGLTLETYNQIAQAAQQDPELRKDIEDRLPDEPSQ